MTKKIFKATGKYLRLSPNKARRVLEQIKGNTKWTHVTELGFSDTILIQKHIQYIGKNYHHQR